MNAMNCPLPDYGNLTDDQVRLICENGFLVTHRKDELVFSENKPISHLMFLQSGLVKLYKERQHDRSVIIKITGPGHYIGLLTLFYDIRYKYSATALEDSVVAYVPLTLIREVAGHNGKYALDLIHELSADGMFLMEKMIRVNQQQVPGRVAEMLLFFYHDIYHSQQYILPLSRQEIADLVYSTKESVSRTLTEFKNDRMIEIEDRKVVLQSIDLLEILCKMG